MTKEEQLRGEVAKVMLALGEVRIQAQQAAVVAVKEMLWKSVSLSLLNKYGDGGRSALAGAEEAVKQCVEGVAGAGPALQDALGEFRAEARGVEGNKEAVER